MRVFCLCVMTVANRTREKSELRAPGEASPMTYQIYAKQFVIIAAGGHEKLPIKLDDALVAFALL